MSSQQRNNNHDSPVKYTVWAMAQCSGRHLEKRPEGIPYLAILIVLVDYISTGYENQFTKFLHDSMQMSKHYAV